MGLLGKLMGKGTNKGANALCLVIGEDKRISCRLMETTGGYFLDNNNRLAFDSFPDAIGACTQPHNGTTRMLGPVTLLYEPTSRPFSFATLDWTKEAHKEDVILDTAFAEGCSRAIQAEDRREWYNKLTTILLIAVLGVLLLTFLIAAQAGTLTHIFSSIPKLFGGG